MKRNTRLVVSGMLVVAAWIIVIIAAVLVNALLGALALAFFFIFIAFCIATGKS